MGRSENYREAPIEPAAIGASLTSLETVKLSVSSEHDVALSVAVNANGVSVIKILSCVDELHSGVLVVWSNGSNIILCSKRLILSGKPF